MPKLVTITIRSREDTLPGLGSRPDPEVEQFVRNDFNRSFNELGWDVVSVASSTAYEPPVRNVIPRAFPRAVPRAVPPIFPIQSGQRQVMTSRLEPEQVVRTSTPFKTFFLNVHDRETGRNFRVTVRAKDALDAETYVSDQYNVLVQNITGPAGGPMTEVLEQQMAPDVKRQGKRVDVFLGHERGVSPPPADAVVYAVQTEDKDSGLQFTKSIAALSEQEAMDVVNENPRYKALSAKALTY